MNISEAKAKTRKLIDQYSRNGVVVLETNNTLKDYLYKMPDYFDTAQKEIAQIKPIRKTYKFSQNLPKNQITNPYEIASHSDEDLTYEAESAGGYSFSVDDVATVYIEYEYPEDTYTALTTINHTTPTGEFTSYTGLIDLPSNALSVRIRFSGDYYYNTKNRALYDVSFSSAARVPECQPYMLYEMPSDFYKFSRVIQKGNELAGNAYRSPYHYWENPKTLALDYLYIGDFSIEYQAVPTTINNDTEDSTEFEVDIDAQEAIPIYAAAMCIQHEDDTVFSELYSIYQGKLMNLDANTGAKSRCVGNSLFTYSKSKLF